MRQIGTIQAMRGVAALAVVAFHAQQELTWRHAPLTLPDLLPGAAGVDVFFVISGFVMAYASAPLFGRAAAVLPFLHRRVARVVPLYWLLTLAYAAYTFGYGLPPHDLHGLERKTALSLGFVPGGPGAAPLLPPGWTLEFEMFFYIGFALLLPLRRRLALGLLAAVLSLFGAAGTLGWVPRGAAALATSQLLEFVAGLGIALLVLAGRRVSRPVAAALVLAGSAAIVLASRDWTAWWPWRGLVWGLPAAAIVAGGALVAEVRDGALHGVLRRLGDASYAVYLVHYLLFGILAREALPWFPPGRVGAGAYFLVLMASAVAAGLALHHGVERPLYRRMTGRSLRPQPRPAPAAA